jgi:hypothetical protein
VGQWCGRRSHGGAEARCKEDEEPTTGHKGNWRVSCSCLYVETPVVAHRCFALPRSSILCGCINFPGRQVNAVWGRYPTACTILYIFTKSLEFIAARRQKLSRLRVEKLGCLVSTCGSSCPAGLFTHPSDQSAVGARSKLTTSLLTENTTGGPCKSSIRRFGLVVRSLPSQEKLFLHRNLSPRHFNEPHTIET